MRLHSSDSQDIQCMYVYGLRGFVFRLYETINMTKPYGCNPDYTMKLRENYGNLPDAIELLTVVCATHIAQLDMTMCCKKNYTVYSVSRWRVSSTSSHYSEITAIKKCWNKTAVKELWHCRLSILIQLFFCCCCCCPFISLSTTDAVRRFVVRRCETW